MKSRSKKTAAPVTPVYVFHGSPVKWYAQSLCERISYVSEASRYVDQPNSVQFIDYCNEYAIAPKDFSRHTEEMLESYVWKLSSELGVSVEEANQYAIENIV